QGRDSQLYGTTAGGGSDGNGVVFRSDLAGNVTVLHSFNGTDGLEPFELVQAPDTNFYGTTLNFGAVGPVTLFRLDSAGNFAKLHTFTFAEGADFIWSLIQGSD